MLCQGVLRPPARRVQGEAGGAMPRGGVGGEQPGREQLPAVSHGPPAPHLHDLGLHARHHHRGRLPARAPPGQSESCAIPSSRSRTGGCWTPHACIAHRVLEGEGAGRLSPCLPVRTPSRSALCSAPPLPQFSFDDLRSETPPSLLRPPNQKPASSREVDPPTLADFIHAWGGLVSVFELPAPLSVISWVTILIHQSY